MSTNFIVKDDSGFKGRLLPLRGSGVQPQNIPFKSRVTAKEQLGLPPVNSNLLVKYLPLPKNSKLKKYVKRGDKLIPLEKSDMNKTDEYFWNKRINPYLEHFNKDKIEESEIKKKVEEEEEKNIEIRKQQKEERKKRLPPSYSATNIESAQNPTPVTEIKPKEFKEDLPSLENKTINKLEPIKEKLVDKPIEKTKIENPIEKPVEKPKIEENNNEIKTVPKENNPAIKLGVNLDDLKLDSDEEDINKEDMNDVLKYINDLDYEKYSKDMELREALQLIKNKMSKDKKEEDAKEEEKKDEEVVENKKEEVKEEEQKEEKSEVILPPIEDPNEIKRQEEIEKYRALEKLSKLDVSL